MAEDGTPRAVPIAFVWNGAEIVMCTPKNAPKLPALRHNPAVALTIDTEVHPPKILLIRGRDFETPLPSAVEELVRQREERKDA
ncbi:pyridoxamine 5'-phosphate oxidase family protein [Streptomyces sp. NPDC060020]|uniref:pyridoxamine 5'-phosphate oxidase family protein n=1 Tax=Streptomyces sp. NPDC060020 TaxID=3347038 RepID=UPI00367B1483